MEWKALLLKLYHRTYKICTYPNLARHLSIRLDYLADHFCIVEQRYFLGPKANKKEKLVMSVFRYRDRSFDIDLRSESGNFSITLIRMDQSLGALCWKLKAEMRRRSPMVFCSTFFFLSFASFLKRKFKDVFLLKKAHTKDEISLLYFSSNVSRFQETLEILRKHPIFGFCSNTLGIHLITSDTIEKKQRNSIVHDKGPPLSSLAHC